MLGEQDTYFNLIYATLLGFKPIFGWPFGKFRILHLPLIQLCQLRKSCTQTLPLTALHISIKTLFPKCPESDCSSILL